jgi:hypothetical protein
VILGIVALALTLPVIPDFTLEALGADPLDATGSIWTSLLWIAAPFFGVTSLLLARKAQQEIASSGGLVSGWRVVTTARYFAWGAAAFWTWTFMGVVAFL